MPTYHYRCPEGHDFDLFQRMSDDPVAECPECGKPAERQLSGGAGFLFKGEGFYITDYRSKEYKERARAEKDTTSGGTKEGGASSDSGAGGSGSKSEKSSGSKPDGPAGGDA